jgi:hypothetical protein
MNYYECSSPQSGWIMAGLAEPSNVDEVHQQETELCPGIEARLFLLRLMGTWLPGRNSAEGRSVQNQTLAVGVHELILLVQELGRVQQVIRMETAAGMLSFNKVTPQVAGCSLNGGVTQGHGLWVLPLDAGDK